MADKQHYTSGSWLVREGQEEEFVRRWKEFAMQSAKTALGSGDFYLLQEKSNPRHFLSFGSWESQEVIDKWRNTPSFREFIGRCKELLDDFQPSDYFLKISSQD